MISNGSFCFRLNMNAFLLFDVLMAAIFTLTFILRVFFPLYRNITHHSNRFFSFTFQIKIGFCSIEIGFFYQ